MNNLNTSSDNLIDNDDLKKYKILSLSNEDKVAYVDHLVIVYPYMNEILNKIDECKNRRNFREPECMFLCGERRSGKNTIIEQFSKKYPDIITDEVTIKPILYCRVPSPAYTGGLISALLDAIGDPFYYKTSTIQKNTKRLKDLLKICQVEMIILDEFQHLIDSKRQKVILESSDWFKNLISDTRIPVLFAGLPDAEKIFIENSQLGDRVLNRRKIAPFSINDKTFRIILDRFDSALPFEHKSSLTQSGMWEKIYIATNGVMGYIKILLKEGTDLALKAGKTGLDNEILFNAYSNHLSHTCIDNPFSPTYNVKKNLKQKYGK